MILILASLGVAVAFLCCFIWAVRSGQFEDTVTPSMRVLTDDGATRPESKKISRPAPTRKTGTVANSNHNPIRETKILW
jgi:cbb3-type cytochrome oxidase maturation protein